MSASFVGQTLLNQFRIDAFLASGGMGTVYRVWDLKRNVPLAMKVLHEDLAEDPSIFKRFKREARALKKLAHPNIVPFYGLHQTKAFAFLLERYIDGPTLKQVLRRRKGKPLPVEEALSSLKALSSALGYAHAHGVVHCDVKPGNVMIEQGGSVYLTDFGVARHAESTTTTLGFAGTAAYMAPEQCRGEEVTAQTDVYALGVMLYEMLIGRRPFRGDERETEGKGSTGAERVRYAHMYLKPPDPHELNPDLPQAAAGVLLKALEKEPEVRFKSVRELYEAACIAFGLDPDAIPSIFRISLAESPAAPVPEPEPFILAADEPRKGLARAISEWLTARWPYALVSIGALLVVLILIFGGRRGEQDSGIAYQESTLGEARTEEPVALPAKTGSGEDGPGTRRTATAVAQLVQVAGSSDTQTPTVQAAPKAGSVRVNSIDHAEMVYIPAGSFTMGVSPSVGYGVCLEYPPQGSSSDMCSRSWYERESPPHEVYLSDYWIQKTEVTIAQYRRCVSDGVCALTDQEGRPSNHPVTNVTWKQAREYCQWAGLHLPSEAQWEKAARGPTERLWPWGDSINTSYLNSYENGHLNTEPVGLYPEGASYYGLLDMAGNVWELVYDCFDKTYYGTSSASSSDPYGPLNCSSHQRVRRGGGYGDVETEGDFNDARVSTRQPYGFSYAHPSVGYRCAGPELP